MHARRIGIESPTQEELGALFLGTIQTKACLLLDKVMAHFEATLSSGGYGTSPTLCRESIHMPCFIWRICTAFACIDLSIRPGVIPMDSRVQEKN